MDMTAHFTYEALPVSEIQTRLLNFAPGCTGREDVLDLEIQVMYLHKAPYFIPAPLLYFAISYFWGDMKGTAEVRVKGRILTVPMNTVKALRSLRFFLQQQGRGPDDAFFWIDAICINQQDHEERAQQVSMMRRIYEAASEVFVWLGDVAADVSASATKEVHQIFEDSLGRFDGITFPPNASKLYRESSDPRRSNKSYLPWFYDRGYNWDAITPLYQSPWFGRLWTIQETVVARRATCAFGEHHMPLYEVTMAAYALARTRHDLPPTDLEPISSSIELAACRLSLNSLRTRTRYSRVGDPSLFDIVQLVHMFSATDLRDMIFGIIGLHRSHRHRLVVDYKLPVSKILAMATIQCIEECDSLEALQLAATHTQREPLGSPTWALRFVPAEKQLAYLLPLRPQFPLQHRFLPFEHIWRSARTNGWESIALRGAACDTIKIVVTLGVIPGSQGADAKGFISKLDEIVDAVYSANISVAGTSTRATPYQVTPWFHRAARITSPGSDAIAEVINSGIYARDQEHELANLALLQRMVGAVNTKTRNMAPSYFEKEFYHAFPQRKRLDRSFYITERGRMGLGPPDAAPGDTICVFVNGPVAFVLRQKEQCWTLVGDTYVHGLAEDESWQRVVSLPDDVLAGGDHKEEMSLRQTFVLV